MATSTNKFRSTAATARISEIRWPDLYAGLLGASDRWLWRLEELAAADDQLSAREWEALKEFLGQIEHRPSFRHRNDVVRLQDYVYDFQEPILAESRLRSWALLADEEAAG